MSAQLSEHKSQGLRPWEDGAYFQSWFPLCLSSQLQPGRVLGRTFLNTRVVLYRDKDGNAVVQSGYCPHLGADLSLGSINDGELRCAYHHWQFSATGPCTRIPSGDPVPPSARIHNYASVEHLGMVWAYNGPTPLFSVPDFPVPHSELLWKVIERDEQPVDAWIPPSNSVDFQHLLSVHNFPQTAIPDAIETTPFFLQYKSAFLHPEGEGKVWGCNTFVQRSLIPLPFESFTMFTSTAVKPGVCRPFFVAAVRKPGNPADLALAERRLDEVAAFAGNLYREDEQVLNTIRIRQPGEARLVKSDGGLAKFFKFIAGLPRARPLDA
jgi:nitrite reductase/ring-hydroxylating ferredoxin subunit